MKLSVLYIAIGPYDRFWSAFFQSCERFFLQDHDKHYFVFTDSKQIHASEKVTLQSVQDLGWPRNTLNRFAFFDSISNLLETSDYCFFFNANTLFLKPISTSEIIPDAAHDFLTNLSFDSFMNSPKSVWPYERNPASSAFLKPDEGERYYQGGLYGGKSSVFLEMNRHLLESVKKDDVKGIIACNNDESHLNKYLATRHPLCLSTRYGRPEEWPEPMNPSIIFRRKETVLGFWRIFFKKKKSFRYLLREIHAKLKGEYGLNLVRISSGFGNQLFQYAFALYLKETGHDAVCLDLSSFKHRTSCRKYDLDLLSELPIVDDIRIYNRHRPPLIPIFKFLFRINPWVRLVDENTKKIPRRKGFTYYDGFWQTSAYIEAIGGWEKWFQPKEKMPEYFSQLAERMAQEHSISIHVRRGDYFSKEYIDRYGICDAEYFERAMGILAPKNTKPRFYLFSDEPQWSAENLLLPPDTVMIENTASHPFWHIWLMAQCRDHIISNSTFGWWGAYMGKHPEKRVIAPNSWIKGQSETIALKEWILI